MNIEMNIGMNMGVTAGVMNIGINKREGCAKKKGVGVCGWGECSYT